MGETVWPARAFLLEAPGASHLLETVGSHAGTGRRSRAVFWAASRAARRPSGGMPKRKAPEGDPRDDEPDDEPDDNEDEEQRRQREDKEDEEMQDRLAKRSSQDRMG